MRRTATGGGGSFSGIRFFRCSRKLYIRYVRINSCSARPRALRRVSTFTQRRNCRASFAKRHHRRRVCLDSPHQATPRGLGAMLQRPIHMGWGQRDSRELSVFIIEYTVLDLPVRASQGERRGVVRRRAIVILSFNNRCGRLVTHHIHRGGICYRVCSCGASLSIVGTGGPGNVVFANNPGDICLRSSPAVSPRVFG